MQYIVSYRVKERWYLWRTPVDTLEEAREYAREIWEREVDKNVYVDVRIAKQRVEKAA